MRKKLKKLWMVFLKLKNAGGRFLRVQIVREESDLQACYNLRFEVFVEEQKVPFDLEKDEEDSNASHFLLSFKDDPVGVGRVVFGQSKEGRIAEVGRIAILKNFRSRGFGKELMREIVSYCKKSGAEEIVLGAQEHALGFYEKLGFEVVGDRYIDANIPHFKMVFEFI